MVLSWKETTRAGRTMLVQVVGRNWKEIIKGGGGALGSSERVRCVFLDLCVLGLSRLQILYCPHIDQFLIVNGHIHVYHHHTVVSFTYRVADGRYYPERQRLTLSLQPGQSRPEGERLPRR